MGDRNIKVSTIKAYLTGVRSAHVDMGFEDLQMFGSPLLQRVIAGIRRLRGEANTRERRPITRDVLRELVATFDRQSRPEANLHAAFCLAFAAFLRIGEFTYSADDRQSPDFPSWSLTRRAVAFRDDHLELSLPASKTDPFRRGVTIRVARIGDDACAYTSLRHLFDRFPAPPQSPLFDAGFGFSRQYVTQALRDRLRILGY